MQLASASTSNHVSAFPLLRTEPVGACPSCGAGTTRVRHRLGDRLHGVPGDFEYRECTACRTVFQDPRVLPEDLPFCYPPEYITHAPAAEPTSAAPAALRERLRLAVEHAAQGRRASGIVGGLGSLLARSEYLRRRAQGVLSVQELEVQVGGSSRALDIGCGRGELLNLLARRGWSVEGVEWDPAAAAVARAGVDAPIHVGDFRTLDLPLGAFQLVVMQHVLEHLESPREALARVRDLLALGGRAVLIFPNPRSLGSRFYGSAWLGWDSPRHLVLPHPESMVEPLEALGLKTRSLRTTARCTPDIWMTSRLIRDGAPEPASASRLPQAQDYVAAAIAGLLCRLGMPAGEEFVWSLERTK